MADRFDAVVIAVEVLCDTVAQFPTFSEAYLNAIEDLDLESRG